MKEPRDLFEWAVNQPVRPNQLGNIALHPHPYQRETSEEAWESVKNSPWMRKQLKMAYEITYRHGPLTMHMIEWHCAQLEDRPIKLWSTPIRRMYDLRDNGLVKLTGETIMCPVSKKNCVTWDVTANTCPETKVTPVKLCPHCGGILDSDNKPVMVVPEKT